MKRIVAFAFIIIACTLLALWSPWLYWQINLGSVFGVKKPDPIAGLQVFSLSGEIEVTVDSKIIGTVKVETSPLIMDKLAPGQHLVTLKRSSDVKNAYWSFNKLVDFEEGTSVVISYNLGPEEEFSEGHIIYAVKKTDITKTTQLRITTNTDNATVQFDNVQPEKMNGNTINESLNLSGQHKVKISKLGFEPLEFTILPEAQEDRDKLVNFDINLDAQLMHQPVEVN